MKIFASPFSVDLTLLRSEAGPDEMITSALVFCGDFVYG